MSDTPPESPKASKHHSETARYLPNPLVHLDTTPLPADWDAKLRSQIEYEVGTLLKKVQHGLLRGGGTDVYTGYRSALTALADKAVLDTRSFSAESPSSS